VGQFYTGTFDRVVFAMDHDAAPQNGESVFSNIHILEVPPPPPPTLTVTVNAVAQDLEVLSYDPAQDTGPATVTADGTTLTLVGNAWKKVNVDCTVTTGTSLSFAFSSVTQGEIHGIGLDTDDAISADRTFQVYGTQVWGIQPDANFAVYPGTGTVTYTIPLDAYPGLDGVAFDRMTFAMDHDAAPQDGESVFDNIVLSGCL
jgi:hypothetical protein